MSVIQKLEAFKWRNLPEDTTKLPTANEDDEPARPLSFDDLAARVRITRNDVVLAQAELARAEQEHEHAVKAWDAASAELKREPLK